jgi:hypothetical protein
VQRWIGLTATLFAALAIAQVASAEDTVSTLTLDGLSFVSFGDERVFALPSGSTIRFQFSPPAADGSRSFSIPPDGVSIAPIELGGDEGTLRYSLATLAAGSMRATAEGGRRMDFTASVNATRATAEGEGSYSYTVPFTTESVEARSLSGDVEIEVQGLRLVEGVWYVQLVGGVSNRADAVPEAGAAVYTVLSGTFDQIP